MVKPENFLKTLGFDVSSDIPERLLKVGLLAANDDAVRNIGDNNIRMVRLCEGSDDVSMTKKQSEVVNVLKDVGSVSVKELCYFTGYTPVGHICARKEKRCRML